jgi:Transmembrane amino acid transporter protein
MADSQESDALPKKDTRSDSLISIELQAPSSQHLDDPESVDQRLKLASYQIPTWKAVFLIFRSLVGIGVLTMPHAVQSFGVNGALVLLPLFTIAILYVLDLVLRIAHDIGFNGSNIDELIVKSGNEKWRNSFSIINNWMMVAGGVANCIFAGSQPSHS